MYVKQIVLQDIRGFRDLKFDLSRGKDSYAGWTVFTGGNGSGKSTLLKAIAIGLVGRDIARALQPSFKGWVREGAENKSAFIKLEICKSAEEDKLVKTGVNPKSAFPVKLELIDGEKDASLSAVNPTNRNNYTTPERGPWAPEAQGWFSCGYGPFRRVFGASSDAMRSMTAPVAERFVTMFNEAASLSEVDQWLRNLKHKELEGRIVEKQQLDLLLEILRDDLMPGGITVDRVDSDGLWLRDSGGAQLSWHEMSDGYRAALALLTDIIRHLISTYGMEDLTERDGDGKIAVKRSGVVLIDEVDAHLHPEWQRQIGFWLKKHFPNIQFLVTSHSPLVCQAADENGLFVLPEAGGKDRPRALSLDEYNKIIAGRADEILLSPAFGLQNTRSPRAVNARAEHAKLQAKKRGGGKLSTEEKALEQQSELFVDHDED
jgi:energy-coupling factor transporter ATP-binding protein EcfA2